MFHQKARGPFRRPRAPQLGGQLEPPHRHRAGLGVRFLMSLDPARLGYHVVIGKEQNIAFSYPSPPVAGVGRAEAWRNLENTKGVRGFVALQECQGIVGATIGHHDHLERARLGFQAAQLLFQQLAAVVGGYDYRNHRQLSHYSHICKKFASISRPPSVNTDSGWNCTPWVG